MITLRAEILLGRALLFVVLAASAFCGGCDTSRSESMSLGDGPLVASGGRAAADSEALFEVPEVNALAVAYGRENLPEYSRLDGRMNIDNPGPLLATNQWPQAPAPDATRLRYVFLPVYTSTSSQAVPVYLPERPYWRGRSY